MQHHSLETITGVLWDITIAGLIMALTVLMPDVFPRWMALCGIPLLTCRLAITSLEVSGTTQRVSGST